MKGNKMKAFNSCKTILQLNRENPNGEVGEKITLALKLSDWYFKQTTNMGDKQLEKIERVLLTTLDKIEELLK